MCVCVFFSHSLGLLSLKRNSLTAAQKQHIYTRTLKYGPSVECQCKNFIHFRMADFIHLHTLILDVFVTQTEQCILFALCGRKRKRGRRRKKTRTKINEKSESYHFKSKNICNHIREVILPAPNEKEKEKEYKKKLNVEQITWNVCKNWKLFAIYDSIAPPIKKSDNTEIIFVVMLIDFGCQKMNERKRSNICFISIFFGLIVTDLIEFIKSKSLIRQDQIECDGWIRIK